MKIDNMKNLHKKLSEVQKEVGAIAKDSKNSFFKNNYFDINGLLKELKPTLNKYGLVVMQPLTNLNDKPALETLIIDVDGGEQIKSIIPLPDNPDPQKMGSIITYFRRYSLQSFFLLQAEDDDGNHASTPQVGGGERLATDKQKEYITSLGGTPKDNMTSTEASTMIEKLKSTPPSDFVDEMPIR